MIKRKPNLYFNQATGDIMQATKSQAKKFSKDWHKLQFVKNEEGKPVMRFRFTDPEGNQATVDISETGEKEVELDGNRKPA